MSQKRSDAHKAFTHRLKEATGCCNISELSQFFEVAHSTVSGWFANMRLPVHQENFLRLRGINPEWVRAGRGKKYCSPLPLGAEAVSLKLDCPLKTDLRRMLKACEHCSAWTAVLQSPFPKQ